MTFNKFRSIYDSEQLQERLGRIRHVALDMDGTIYMGMTLFDYTRPFLQRLR
jgi:NagD protein